MLANQTKVNFFFFELLTSMSRESGIPASNLLRTAEFASLDNWSAVRSLTAQSRKRTT